jgi:PAS domain S-box-containing protein
MDFPAERTLLQTPEFLFLPQQALTVEQELRQCREELQAARTAQHRFDVFSERVTDYAFITFDPENRITSWSRGAERILGYAEAEILGQPGSIFFTPEDRSKGGDEQELATARREGCAEDERWHLRRDGSRFWGSGIMTAHRDSQGHLQGYSKIFRDLTARRVMEEQLRDSEERFRLFSDNVTDYALVPVDTAGIVSGWNAGAERTFGYPEAEIVGQPVRLFFTPEDREKGESEKDLSRALTQGRAEDERWMVRRDGRRFWARWVTTPMRDKKGDLRGFAKVLRDETERKELEDQHTRSLQEKELLLREIHHRVKNNLHVIASLLSLQASQVNDGKMQQVLDELQDRVHAIATLHETLYGSQDLAQINFGPYMQEIVRRLVGFYALDRERIQVCLEADDVALSLEQALPLGLIVNELFSNSLKHAFPGARRGTIQVHFRYLRETVLPGQTLDEAWCELSVQDDGVGISNTEELWQGKSMGLRIIRLLTGQLHGRVALDGSHSTRFTVQFPLQEFGEQSVAAHS